MNNRLARETIQVLAKIGVREICVCPGSRNAPWIHELQASSDFRVYYHFEERSAAFFALGRIRATGSPVAVMTTSGTAAGELLPATMEAFYSGLPLVLMTADRPRRFRKTGAPQSAEQVELFGQYAKPFDLAGDEKVELPTDARSPLHLNVCFEEPMKQDTSVPKELRSSNPGYAKTVRSPLVVVGALTAEERPLVRDFLLRYGAPTYFEALSGLRESPELEKLRIHNADKIFDRASETGYPIDGVLRIGGIPTHRLWRDLEDRFPELPVMCLSRTPFSGLARPTESRFGDLEKSLGIFEPLTGLTRKAQSFYEQDRSSKSRLLKLMETEPQSEAGLFHSLSKVIPAGARVFVGNSLPVREWDLAADWNERGIEVYATRGVNGIDGQISTFLGLCDPKRSNWAVIGDLTALYDLAGPWALRQMDVPVNLVIVNNGGGKIFDRMYPQREFQNPHELGFSGLATLWELDYVLARDIDSAWGAPHERSRLIELVPDASATRRFWERYTP